MSAGLSVVVVLKPKARKTSTVKALLPMELEAYTDSTTVVRLKQPVVAEPVETTVGKMIVSRMLLFSPRRVLFVSASSLVMF